MKIKKEDVNERRMYMELNQNELFLLKEVFTKVKYDKISEKYIIKLDDYIHLNLTIEQLNLLEKMCQDNDIELEKLPRQLTAKETTKLFNEYYQLKEEISLRRKSKNRIQLEQRLINIRNEIAEGHLYTIYKLIGKEFSDVDNVEDKEDMYQDAYEILIKLIDEYDSSKEITFITFIEKSIIESTRSKQEIESLSIESIDKHLEDISKDEDIEIPNEYLDYTIEEQIFRSLSKDAVAKILELIPLNHRKVLILHFGLEDGIPRKQVEIARIMGVTKGRINTMLHDIIRRLKRYPYKNILLELYEREHPYPNQEKEDPYTERLVQIAINDGHSTLSTEIEFIEEQYFKNMPESVIIEILKELPQTYRELLILYYGIGTEIIRDYEVLSKKLGIPKSLIYQNRQAALKQFKKVLATKYNQIELTDKYNNEYMVYHYLNTSKKRH